jgi:processing peptidase subunit alpha
LRRVAKQVFTGLVENAGKGTGAPTVVIQEALEDGVRSQIAWEDVQNRIARWKLGRL